MINPNPLEEYTAELQQLAEEWDLGKDTAKQIGEREKVIRARILDIADKVDAGHRVEMPIPDMEKKWDRQLSRKPGTGEVSLDKMESLLGTKEYKRLCCTRRTVYDFDMDKFQESREAGLIVDAHLAACEVPAEYTPRLVLSKMTREELGELNGEPEVWG